MREQQAQQEAPIERYEVRGIRPNLPLPGMSVSLFSQQRVSFSTRITGSPPTFCVLLVLREWQVSHPAMRMSLLMRQACPAGALGSGGVQMAGVRPRAAPTHTSVIPGSCQLM